MKTKRELIEDEIRFLKQFEKDDFRSGLKWDYPMFKKISNRIKRLEKENSKP